MTPWSLAEQFDLTVSSIGNNIAIIIHIAEMGYENHTDDD